VGIALSATVYLSSAPVTASVTASVTVCQALPSAQKLFVSVSIAQAAASMLSSADKYQNLSHPVRISLDRYCSVVVGSVSGHLFWFAVICLFGNLSE
jgi:hypothetical protein